MGQQPTRATVVEIMPEIATTAAKREDTLGLWPGLETQLEMSFSSLDLTETGLLPHSTLEPVLRHHLLQIGLIEYASRFTTAEGALDSSEIVEYLKEYDLRLCEELSLVQWKNFALAWIRRIQDAQHDDIEKWQNSMKDMQEQQQREYQLAIKQFQDGYLTQLEHYYRAVDETQRKEDEYRQEWERSLSMQEEYYNNQMGYMQEKNEEAMAQSEKQTKASQDIRSEYMKHLQPSTVKGPGNISIISYTYPTDMTENGAPISGGAVIPFRRSTNRNRRTGCC